jgi:succinoglycan biosynthesis protein ExoO
MPRVSVLIPVYNCEKMILRAIDSALSQTLKDIEIIIIDDASTDRTADLIADCHGATPRIRLYSRTQNGGPGAARNMGIHVACGEWLALLDADDLMRPERLERLLESATENDVLIADNLEMYDLHAKKVVKRGIDVALLASGIRLDCRGFAARCKTNQSNAIDFGLLKPLIRTSHVREHGIFYDESLRHGEDFLFYLETLLAGGTLLVLPDAYYRYTERTGSITRKASGVSATRGRYDVLESQTQALANNHRYAIVATELNLRAEAFRRLAKMAAFHQRSRLDRLAMLPRIIADHEMRSYFGSRILAQVGRLWPRL